MLRYTRREVIQSGLGAAGALVLPSNRAAAGGPLLFFGGLILGEVVLGVLRAYDIDLGRTVESAVRSLRRKFEPRIRAEGAPASARCASPVGASESGRLQVTNLGYLVSVELHSPRPVGLWVPGEVLYGAANPGAEPRSLDLSRLRCGYPTSEHRKNHPDDKDYYVVWQAFQHGEVKVVVRQGSLPGGEAYFQRPVQDIVLDVKWS